MNNYDLLRKYLEFAQNDKSHNAVIIKGRAGVGKTTLIKESIKDNLCLNGHITPKDLFLLLKENNDTNIILDDVDSLLINKTSVGLIKSATIPTNDNMRIVSYFSSTNSDEQYFEFAGKLFLLANTFPNNPDINAILSRSFVVNFNPTNREVIEELLKLKCVDIEIIEFLSKEFGELKPLNFRHYNKVVGLKSYFPTEWKELSSNLFNQSNKFNFAQELASSGKPINEQIKDFIEKTGKSRRTYFRHKKVV